MLRLTCQLTIGRFTLDFVNDIQIESTWQQLTDTCSIRLPRKALVLGGQLLPDVLKVGERVEVKYGYDGVLRTEFVGYIVGVKTGPPAEIQCEDEMYLLKRKPITHSWRSVSLQGLLEYIRSQAGLSFGIETLGAANLGKFTINQATGAQALDALRKDYGIRSFFRAGVLIAGDPYKAVAQAPRHLLTFSRNVISNDLQYVRAQDVRIKVRAISHIEGKKKGRKRIVKEFGDLLDGELRTLNFVGVAEADLEARAKAELARLRFDGYRGTLTTFGAPYVEHGDVVVIQDPDYPEREGAYAVDKVVKSFGVGGSRRVITLGPKA
ncbi:hypothetical protein [Hymenobacter metallicola]|uniref:Phage late control D family protein n=1 Tax=Hymenobacter metallicola TaxID=2563114 RepID=A0A4Z0Q0R8_9BACT|nr:hypothetical protein [Hymenobacter metallicola]TGE23557.1 hypothetical protein E5K02_20440 [Hymenobacter metallicola]